VDLCGSGQLAWPIPRADAKQPKPPRWRVATAGKRGGSLSQEFTRVRRKVLGEAADRTLDLHALRLTWATVARHVGVDERTWLEMGGWTQGKGAHLTYDHGLELKRYLRDQEKVARCFKDKGYLG